MGLKVNQTTKLDDLFDKFAVDPDKKRKEEAEKTTKAEDKTDKKK